MQPQNLFEDLVNTFSCNHNTSIQELYNFIEELDKLPDYEKDAHHLHIELIKNTVKGYGKLTDDTKKFTLTDKQIDRFKLALHNRCGNKKRRTHNPSLMMEPYDPLSTMIKIQHLSSIPSLQPIYPSNLYEFNFSQDDPSSIPSLAPIYHNYINNKKPDFGEDDVIFSIVFGLLINMNRDTTGSSLTNYILEYLESIEILLESDDEKRYVDITRNITRCLENYGWICKNANTLGGFKTEPKRVELVKDLEKIVNLYF